MSTRIRKTENTPLSLAASSTLRARIHPDAIAIYDWVQSQRDIELFIGSRSGVDRWLDDLAADQAFREFMQTTAEAAGRLKQWPTNDLAIRLTNDPEIRARARMNLPTGPRIRMRAAQ